MISNKYVDEYIKQYESGNIKLNKERVLLIGFLKKHVLSRDDLYFDEEQINNFKRFTEKWYFPLEPFQINEWKGRIFLMGTIRDRAIIKLQAALMLPEHKTLNIKMGEIDYFQNRKRVLDEYQVEEFENNIHYAMVYHLRFDYTTKEIQLNCMDTVCIFILLRKSFVFRRKIIPLKKFSLMKLLV
ncbi:hypothetical protein ASG97_22785 [Bacillus sp. Soil745]|nr:hypothetical protein ASG97_22785 [Bacillus sp. Soil745]